MVYVQVHIRRHGSAGGTVSGREPFEQLSPSEDPKLQCASWRRSHPRDAQQCHRPHRHQPISAQDGATPPHTHVPQRECVTVHSYTPAFWKGFILLSGVDNLFLSICNEWRKKKKLMLVTVSERLKLKPCIETFFIFSLYGVNYVSHIEPVTVYIVCV